MATGYGGSKKFCAFVAAAHERSSSAYSDSNYLLANLANVLELASVVAEP